MKLNQTLIKAFDCPRQGHLLAKQIEKHGKLPGGEVAEVGHAVHQFVAAYLKHCMAVALPTDLDYGYKLKDAIAAAYPTTLNYDDYSRIVDTFLGAEAIPEFGEIYIEKKLETDQIHGTPDKITIESQAYVLIEDWKTNRQIMTQAQVEREFQLPFYTWLFLLTQPEDIHPDVFELALVFLRYGHVVSYEKTQEEVWAWGERAQLRIDRILAMTEFPAIPGTCKFCDFVLGCPEAVVDEIETDPVALAERFKLVALTNKKIDLALKEIVRTSGPIKLQGERLDFYEISTLSWPDMNRVLDVLLEYDISREDAWRALSPTKTALKKLCRGEDGAEMWKRLEEIAETGKQTRFGFLKE